MTIGLRQANRLQNQQYLVSHIKQISNYKRFLKQIIMAQREGEKTVRIPKSDS